MQLRPGLILLPLLAASTWVHAAIVGGDYVGSTSNFAIVQKTEVPGQILKPGDYTIHILDQLSDRMIVRVDSATSKDHAIFLAVPNASINNGGGIVSYPSSPKGTQALRGYSFASGSAVEFVYPKTEAVALAKLNSAKVIAVDPESQGMPTALKSLSDDDLKIVNLWMLSMTTTGVDNKTPAVLAQRFHSDRSASETVVASASKPAPQPPTQVASLDPQQSDSRIWDPLPTTSHRRPVLAKLPKTASSLPIFWMLGFFCFVAAAGVRFCMGSTANV